MDIFRQNKMSVVSRAYFFRVYGMGVHLNKLQDFGLLSFNPFVKKTVTSPVNTVRMICNSSI